MRERGYKCDILDAMLLLCCQPPLLPFSELSICLLLFFGSLVLSVSVPTAEVSLDSAKLSKRVLGDTITCSSFYGHPLFADCEAAVQQIYDVLGDDVSARDRWNNNYYEFIGIGGESQFGESGEYNTPLYFRSGESQFVQILTELSLS